MEAKEVNKFWPTIPFEPLFFILDKECKWVMAVEKEDKYAYKGVYIAYYGPGKWEVWPAYKNKQQPVENYPSFDFTKEEAMALKWAVDNQHLPDSQDVSRGRVEGFPKY